MMMRVKYNNFYTPRFHRKNKSFSPALSSLVFDTRQNARKSKNQKSKKKVVSTLSGFYPNFIHNPRNAHALSTKDTHAKKSTPFSFLSLSLV